MIARSFIRREGGRILKHNFGPASRDETHVFGASRPGYGATKVSNKKVDDWIAFMRERGIARICCLLSKVQLAFYDDLLLSYKNAFGADNVLWAPVEDFHLAEHSVLIENVLPFLSEAVGIDRKVVLHCSAGQGRTGHILAAWLVYGRNMDTEVAIHSVEKMGRSPYDAEGRHEHGKRALHELLESCRKAGKSNAE